jgi:hypothetical protein
MRLNWVAVSPAVTACNLRCGCTPPCSEPTHALHRDNSAAHCWTGVLACRHIPDGDFNTRFRLGFVNGVRGHGVFLCERKGSRAPALIPARLGQCRDEMNKARATVGGSPLAGTGLTEGSAMPGKKVRERQARGTPAFRHCTRGKRAESEKVRSHLRRDDPAFGHRQAGKRAEI